MPPGVIFTAILVIIGVLEFLSAVAANFGRFLRPFADSRPEVRQRSVVGV